LLQIFEVKKKKKREERREKREERREKREERRREYTLVYIELILDCFPNLIYLFSIYVPHSFSLLIFGTFLVSIK